MMIKRKALMLTREDNEMQEIADSIAALSKLDQEQIDELQDQARKLFEQNQVNRKKALTAVEARLKKLGVLYDKNAHDISFNPEEGIIWLESKHENCTCPQCQISRGIGVIIGIQPPQ